jgi:hypothetical protein
MSLCAFFFGSSPLPLLHLSAHDLLTIMILYYWSYIELKYKLDFVSSIIKHTNI